MKRLLTSAWLGRPGRSLCLILVCGLWSLVSGLPSTEAQMTTNVIVTELTVLPSTTTNLSTTAVRLRSGGGAGIGAALYVSATASSASISNVICKFNVSSDTGSGGTYSTDYPVTVTVTGTGTITATTWSNAAASNVRWLRLDQVVNQAVVTNTVTVRTGYHSQ